MEDSIALSNWEVKMSVMDIDKTRKLFCLATAEVFLMNPYARSSIARWNTSNWDCLRGTLDEFWLDMVQVETKSRDYRFGLEDIKKAVPDDEDATWDGLPEAQSAGMIVFATSILFMNGENQMKDEVSTLALECVTSFMNSRCESNEEEDLVTFEKNRQDALLNELREFEFSQQNIARVKISALENHYTFRSF